MVGSRSPSHETVLIAVIRVNCHARMHLIPIYGSLLKQTCHCQLNLISARSKYDLPLSTDSLINADRALTTLDEVQHSGVCYNYVLPCWLTFEIVVKAEHLLQELSCC